MYIRDLISIKPLSHYSICPNNKLLLEYPVECTKRTMGDRVSCSAAPKLWKGLLNNIGKSKTLTIFKNLLKTYFFKKAFYQFNLYNFFIALILI